LSERSIVAHGVMKEAIHIFGECTDIPITNELLQAVKQAHSEYAVLLEEYERKSEKDEEAQRAAEKAKNDLSEQLKEQQKLEESQLLKQDTARQFQRLIRN